MRILMVETGGASASVYAADWLSTAANLLADAGHEVCLAVPPDSLPADRTAHDGVEVRVGGPPPAVRPTLWRSLPSRSFDLTFAGDEAAFHWAAARSRRSRMGGLIGVGFLPDPPGRRERQRLVDHLDGLVLLSRDARAGAEERHWLAGARIDNIPLGVSVEALEARVRSLGGRHACRRRYDYGPDDFVVGCVTAPGPDPGYEVLLEAFERTAATLPACRLLIVADQETGDLLRALAGRLPNAARCTTWLTGGHLPERYIPAMDALVEPRSDAGVQFSRPVLLAMTHYVTPVIAGARALSEQVRDGRDGVVVPPEDAAALHEALLRLGSDPGLRRRLSRGSRSTVEAHFTAERMRERVDSYVASLLS